MTQQTETRQTMTRQSSPPPTRIRGRGTRQAAARGRGLLAAVVLAALLVGLPVVLLITVGLPQHGTSWANVGHRLVRPDTDGTVFIGAVAVVGWLCWACFAVSTVVEAVALARGRPARRLPLLGPSQRCAAVLLATVWMLLTSTPGLATASPPGVARPAVTQQHASSAGLEPVSPAPSPPSVAVSAPAAADVGPVVVVRPRDTLWGLAVTHLGSGPRWHEIAALNNGRPQPDGRTLVDDNLIIPGWRLVLPADATHLPAAPRTAPVRRPAKVPGPPADHASAGEPGTTDRSTQPPGDRAGAHLGDAATGSASRQVSPPRPAIPVVPARPDPAGSASARSDIGRATEPSAPGSDLVRPAADRGQELTLGVAGAGLLAAGLLVELRRRRRRFRQSHPHATTVSAPPPRAARAELGLRAAADTSAATALQQVLRHLASPLPARNAGPTSAHELLTVRLSASDLTVRWIGHSPPPPPPWQPLSTDGWQLPASARPQLLAAPCPMQTDLFPALITLGRDRDDAYVLLNLAAVGSAALIGPDPEAVRAQLTTWAWELATSSWGGGWFHLAAVGVHAVTGCDRTLTYASVEEVLPHVLAHSREAAAALEELGAAAGISARLAEPDDDRLCPMVLVSSVPPNPDQWAQLAAAAAGTRGIVTVLCPSPTASSPAGPVPAQLPAGAAELVLDPLDGLHARLTTEGVTTTVVAGLTPQALTVQEMDDVDVLFATADDPAGAKTGSAEPSAPEGFSAGSLLPELDLLPVPAVDPDTAEQGDNTLDAPEPDEATAVLTPGPTGVPTVALPKVAAESGAEQVQEARVIVLPTATVGPLEPAAAHVPAPAVMVRILGSVEVVGAAQRLTASRGLELVLLIALHGPGGVSGDRVLQALSEGPDSSITPDYRSKIVSMTRRQLGVAADGSERLQFDRTRGCYRLHPEVVLDYTLLRDRAAGGAREDLQAALDLVGGEPFAGVDFWWLPDFGAGDTEIRETIVAAASRLADLELAAGDTGGAVAAATAGLRVGPDERLYRAVMLAHHRSGNRAGITATMRDCLAGLRSLGIDEPHLDTVVLYRELTADVRSKV